MRFREPVVNLLLGRWGRVRMIRDELRLKLIVVMRRVLPRVSTQIG